MQDSLRKTFCVSANSRLIFKRTVFKTSNKSTSYSIIFLDLYRPQSYLAQNSQEELVV